LLLVVYSLSLSSGINEAAAVGSQFTVCSQNSKHPLLLQAVLHDGIEISRRQADGIAVFELLDPDVTVELVVRRKTVGTAELSVLLVTANQNIAEVAKEATRPMTSPAKTSSNNGTSAQDQMDKLETNHNDHTVAHSGKSKSNELAAASADVHKDAQCLDKFNNTQENLALLCYFLYFSKLYRADKSVHSTAT
jgi:hypothetical protein